MTETQDHDASALAPQTLARAKKFLSEDPDPETRLELQTLVTKAVNGDAAAAADLDDRFAGSLTFGTAGLRGRVEAGTARMNRAVVMRATYGLTRALFNHFGLSTAMERGVVVGFDGRLSSRQFAEDAAAVLTAQNIPVHLWIDPCSTPLCAFAVEKLHAVAGIMVTASHNPPADNGYKVYWDNAAQIIPPHDKNIHAAFDDAMPAHQVSRRSPPDAAALGLRKMIGDDIERAYLEEVKKRAWHRSPQSGLPQVGTPVPLRLVYTAMHGVGHRMTIRALLQAGFDGVVDVPSQVDPDGTFRTVAFPNPEEKGALDRAFEVAKEAKAELILANDPDADRLAVAVSVDEGKTFRALTGNEIGILLCADALDHANVGDKKKLVITSLVSSTFLSRMAKDKGAAYAETLTGFKWIANEAIKREAQGEAFVCGYEEALGYSVSPLIKDKDGIGAAVRFAEMARSLKAQGKTVLDRLDELSLAHGASVAHNWSITLPGASGMEKIKGVMAQLRSQPLTSLCGEKVTNTNDLQHADIPADVIVVFTGKGERLTIRPSGTEPKIKFYFEMVARATSKAELATATAALQTRGVAVEKEVRATLGV